MVSVELQPAEKTSCNRSHIAHPRFRTIDETPSRMVAGASHGRETAQLAVDRTATSAIRAAQLGTTQALDGHGWLGVR